MGDKSFVAKNLECLKRAVKEIESGDQKYIKTDRACSALAPLKTACKNKCLKTACKNIAMLILQKKNICNALEIDPVVIQIIS